MTMNFIDPFETLLRLQRSLDNPRVDERFGFSTTGAGTFPPVNVFQRGSDFVVMAELPGIDKASLTVEVQKNHVRVAGRRPSIEGDGKSYHRRERADGDFDRTVTLPVPVDSGRTQASYRDGILTVTLPPVEEAQPRAITVSSS